jgi:hypothetical protein
MALCAFALPECKAEEEAWGLDEEVQVWWTQVGINAIGC